MDVSELRQALEHRHSPAEWVAEVGRYFQSHDLTYGHGTDNASDEAYWLIRAVQGWGAAAWEGPASPADIPRILTLAQQRVLERKPLAYLLGEAWFAGLRFVVDERVLIPRSPLAEIIERGFEPWCQLRPSDRVVDIGTGSGCLAIAIAHYCPGIHVDATDLSDDALAVAKLNVEQQGLQDRVRLIRSDLFSELRGEYRVVISNPPYVPEGSFAALPEEYRHEPVAALAAGETGLDLIHGLLVGAAKHLAADGLAIIEVGEAQEAFMDAYEGLPVTWFEFERGGAGVLLLTRDDLTGYLTG